MFTISFVKDATLSVISLCIKQDGIEHDCKSIDNSNNINARTPIFAQVRYVEQQKLLKRQKRGSLRRASWRLPVQRSDPVDVGRRVILHDKQIELPIRHYADPSVYQRFNHDNDAIRLRDFSERNAGCRVNFKDPFYSDMWYLVSVYYINMVE